MRSLIALIEEGQKIAAGAFGGKDLKGFRERHAAWSRKVKKELQDDPLCLARLNNAERIGQRTPGIPFGTEVTWQKLQGQLAVLIELEREQPKPEEIFTFKPTLHGMGINLKAAWRWLCGWWTR